VSLLADARAAAQTGVESPHTGKAQDNARKGASSQTGAYGELVASAVAAFDAGNYVEARELMMRAHQLRPAARTLRGMGLAALQAKRYAVAGMDFERALAENREALTDEQREEVEHLQAEANALTARYRLTGQVPGAAILIDQEPPLMDAAGFLVLEEGDHTLSLRPAGGDERTMTIHAEGGKWSDLDLGSMRVRGKRDVNPWLQSATATPAPDPPLPRPAQRIATRPPRILAAPAPAEPAPVVDATPRSKSGDGLQIILASAAIGGAAIASGFAIWQWRSRESEVDVWNSRKCLDAGLSRRENCGSHERAYKSAERWTWVAASTALVLTAGAITLFVVGGSEEAERHATAHCGVGALAISCQGSF
jgi:tetratricopeptide (TPR) repeat protein